MRPSVTLEIFDDEGRDPAVSTTFHNDGMPVTPAEILAAYVRCCTAEVYQQALAFVDEQMEEMIRGNQ